MIQRIQTIYLLLAFICMVLLLVFPIFTISVEGSGIDTINGEFGAYGIITDGSDSGRFPMYIIFVILALLSAAGILLFKNRKKQLVLTRLNFIAHVLTIIAIYSVYYLGRGALEEGLADKAEVATNISVNFGMGIGFFLLIPAGVFVFLAIRGIKTDIKLVSLTDRLR